MTREEYIQQKLREDEERIGQLAAARQQTSNWQESLGPDKIFPAIMEGMLTDLHGQIFDQIAINAKYEAKIKDLIAQLNNFFVNAYPPSQTFYISYKIPYFDPL